MLKSTWHCESSAGQMLRSPANTSTIAFIDRGMPENTHLFQCQGPMQHLAAQQGWPKDAAVDLLRMPSAAPCCWCCY